MDADALVAAVRGGPSGPSVGAFFDYQALMDPTQRHRYPGDRAHRSEDELRQLGEEQFKKELAGDLFHDTWRMVRAHIRLGHTVVLMASEPSHIVRPLAQELGVTHVLCAGAGQRLPGAEKQAAVHAFAAQAGVDLSRSHAYAHSVRDFDVLKAVGFAHPTNPDPALAREATALGWHTVDVKPKPAKRNPIAAVRTGAMFASLVAAAGAGIAAGIATQDRRRGRDVATTLFGRAAPVLGDIKVEIQGGEHLWSVRPAVFFANHQSSMIDVLMLARILERQFTFVAKAEARDMPIVGQVFDLADVAFVDRSNSANAIAALQPAIDKLRNGTSIAISPEGTRSLTPSIGAFKKGGFHMARDAGVPIVPIVVRNAGEIMWRDAAVAHGGVVEVMVHEPVPTAGWRREDIGPWLDRMHQLYVDTLDDWPGTEPGRRWSAAIATARETEKRG